MAEYLKIRDIEGKREVADFSTIANGAMLEKYGIEIPLNPKIDAENPKTLETMVALQIMDKS
jgi:hypothetical protein